MLARGRARCCSARSTTRTRSPSSRASSCPSCATGASCPCAQDDGIAAAGRRRPPRPGQGGARARACRALAAAPPTATSGAANVIRTGEPEFHPQHDRRAARAAWRATTSTCATLRAARLHVDADAAAVDARADARRDRLHAATRADRAIGPAERALAEELAERAAVTLDNARLYLRARARRVRPARLARPARGDPRRRRRRRDRAGRDRQDGLRQRGGAASCSASPRSRRSRRCRSATCCRASRSSTRTGKPFPPERLPGRQALMGEEPDDVARAHPPPRHRRGPLVDPQGDADPRRRSAT